MEPSTAICLAVFWLYYITQILSYYTHFVFTMFHAIHQMPPLIHPLDVVIISLIVGILLSLLCLIHPGLLLAFVGYNVFEAYIRLFLPHMQLV